jgi:succinate dehydrogenase / fumarate reductase, cytochrome b subunit
MNVRPTSPFMTYRFAYTMLLSFSHRVAGVAMAVGLIALAAWLMAAAGGPGAYAAVVQLYSGWFFRLLLCAWLLAFLFHFANGIRHLLWDAGKGLEKSQARGSAVVVVIWTVLAFALCLWMLL